MSDTSDQEALLAAALSGAGFEPSGYSTETSTIWVNKANRRALTVPLSFDGYYPSWMLEELEDRARKIGELTIAETAASIKGRAPS